MAWLVWKAPYQGSGMALSNKAWHHPWELVWNIIIKDNSFMTKVLEYNVYAHTNLEVDIDR